MEVRRRIQHKPHHSDKAVGSTTGSTDKTGKSLAAEVGRYSEDMVETTKRNKAGHSTKVVLGTSFVGNMDGLVEGPCCIPRESAERN
jgi:hypothetical protein